MTNKRNKSRLEWAVLLVASRAAACSGEDITVHDLAHVAIYTDCLGELPPALETRAGPCLQVQVEAEGQPIERLMPICNQGICDFTSTGFGAVGFDGRIGNPVATLCLPESRSRYTITTCVPGFKRTTIEWAPQRLADEPEPIICNDGFEVSNFKHQGLDLDYVLVKTATPTESCEAPPVAGPVATSSTCPCGGERP